MYSKGAFFSLDSSLAHKHVYISQGDKEAPKQTKQGSSYNKIPVE